MVTPDELGDPGRLSLRTWVNDELRQDSTTSDLIFDCAAQIAYLTTAFPLEPGTIIATGTPAGVGAGFDPPASCVMGTWSASKSRESAGSSTRCSRAPNPSRSASGKPAGDARWSRMAPGTAE
jgi:2-keto-4-pentenoate hydratase/2-oxohepta-3-ene-1,7-dioic acid hydratase in catechol pathway